jgi:hypothetical protein
MMKGVVRVACFHCQTFVDLRDVAYFCNVCGTGLCMFCARDSDWNLTELERAGVDTDRLWPCACNFDRIVERILTAC